MYTYDELKLLSSPYGYYADKATDMSAIVRAVRRHMLYRAGTNLSKKKLKQLKDSNLLLSYLDETSIPE